MNQTVVWPLPYQQNSHSIWRRAGGVDRNSIWTNESVNRDWNKQHYELWWFSRKVHMFHVESEPHIQWSQSVSQILWQIIPSMYKMHNFLPNFPNILSWASPRNDPNSIFLRDFFSAIKLHFENHHKNSIKIFVFLFTLREIWSHSANLDLLKPRWIEAHSNEFCVHHNAIIVTH